MNDMQLSSLFTPDYSHVTGLLQHLSSDELKELLESNEKTDSMIKDLQQIKSIEAEREMLVVANKSISEFNLSQEPILESNRKQLEETYTIAVDLKSSLCELKQKLEGNKSQLPLDTLLALLQTAAAEEEEKAEATVDMFLKSELSVEDFLSRYLEERKLAHLRRTKSEKMVNLMRDAGKVVATPPSRPQRLRKPPPPPVPNRPNPAPYPYPNINSMPQSNGQLQPSRQAPQPPIANGYQYQMPLQPYGANVRLPTPFTYCSPYPQPYGTPQQVPRYR